MGKIILQNEIPLLLKNQREKTIVAACGCFDIFHIGHLEYLHGAKQKGDVLIVGVNSDQSVLKNKKQMPLFSIQDRLQLLCAITYVDYVFSFDQKTFDYSLTLIRPNLFARGVDAADKSFPEEKTVKREQIEIVYIGDYKKSSSRELRYHFAVPK